MQKLEIEYFMNFGIRYFNFSTNANPYWVAVESDVLNALELDELNRKSVPLAKGSYTLIRDFDVFAAFEQSEAPFVHTFKAFVESLPSRFRISNFVWKYMLPDTLYEIINMLRMSVGISDTRLFSMLLPGHIKDMGQHIKELNKQNVAISHTQAHLITNSVFNSLYNSPGYYHILKKELYLAYSEVFLGVIDLMSLEKRLNVHLPVYDIMLRATRCELTHIA
jgi:hypothetical protein